MRFLASEEQENCIEIITIKKSGYLPLSCLLAAHNLRATLPKVSGRLGTFQIIVVDKPRITRRVKSFDRFPVALGVEINLEFNRFGYKC